MLRFSSPTQPEPVARFLTVLTSYVDSPLVSGQTYVYRVQALGSGSLRSDVSQFVSATVPLDSRPPAVPGVLSGRLSGDTTIRLTWVAPKTDEGGGPLSGLASYRVYRAEGTGSAGFLVLATVDSTRVSYDDVGLKSATTYIYRVSALDAQLNESGFSSSVSQTTGSTGSISAPTNVAASVQNDPDLGTIVRVTWTAPAGITLFRVDRQVAGSSSNSSFETVVPSQSGTVYNDTNIVSGRTYIYRVLSLQGSQSSTPSELKVVAVP
ncbi:MAG: fibronectin type III domain-containing protein [bacterium]|nr:fibronectin type III domain-containing protein [bacterium]